MKALMRAQDARVPKVFITPIAAATQPSFCKKKSSPSPTIPASWASRRIGTVVCMAPAHMLIPTCGRL